MNKPEHIESAIYDSFFLQLRLKMLRGTITKTKFICPCPYCRYKKVDTNNMAKLEGKRKRLVYNCRNCGLKYKTKIPQSRPII